MSSDNNDRKYDEWYRKGITDPMYRSEEARKLYTKYKSRSIWTESDYELEARRLSYEREDDEQSRKEVIKYCVMCPKSQSVNPDMYYDINFSGFHPRVVCCDCWNSLREMGKNICNVCKCGVYGEEYVQNMHVDKSVICDACKRVKKQLGFLTQYNKMISLRIKIDEKKASHNERDEKLLRLNKIEYDKEKKREKKRRRRANQNKLK